MIALPPRSDSRDCRKLAFARPSVNCLSFVSRSPTTSISGLNSPVVSRSSRPTDAKILAVLLLRPDRSAYMLRSAVPAAEKSMPSCDIAAREVAVSSSDTPYCLLITEAVRIAADIPSTLVLDSAAALAITSDTRPKPAAPMPKAVDTDISVSAAVLMSVVPATLKFRTSFVTATISLAFKPAKDSVLKASAIAVGPTGPLLARFNSSLLSMTISSAVAPPTC